MNRKRIPTSIIMHIVLKFSTIKCLEESSNIDIEQEKRPPSTLGTRSQKSLLEDYTYEIDLLR